MEGYYQFSIQSVLIEPTRVRRLRWVNRSPPPEALSKEYAITPSCFIGELSSKCFLTSFDFLIACSEISEIGRPSNADIRVFFLKHFQQLLQGLPHFPLMQDWWNLPIGNSMHNFAVPTSLTPATGSEYPKPTDSKSVFQSR